MDIIPELSCRREGQRQYILVHMRIWIMDIIPELS